MNHSHLVLCHSWHIQTCGFIQQLCKLYLFHSGFLFVSCLSSSAIYGANVTVADKATSVRIYHSGVVCVGEAVGSASLVNGVEFSRSASELGL